MGKLKFFGFNILIALFSVFSLASAQVLNVRVTVKMEHLQPRDQSELSDLEQRLTDYLATTQWSEENQDIVLDCNLNLIIETVTSRGSEKVYRSQFLISSPSGENFYDKSCEFTYHPGQAMDAFRTYFDPLLSLVDFYAYMVIAGELDTYSLLGGTSFYDRAQDIANQGQLSNYSTGWTKRLEEVILITDADHIFLREAKFYFYEGLYFVEEEPNKENARKFVNAVVERLAKVYNKRPNSKALKRFMDAHYQEFCKFFLFAPNQATLDKLIQIDARHRDTYLKCSESF